MPKSGYIPIALETGGKNRGAANHFLAGDRKHSALAPIAHRSDVPVRPERSGTDSDSIQAARSKARGVPATKGLSTFRRGVSRKSLTLFTRQLATLLRAGLPLLRALEVLARPERNPTLRGVVAGLAEAIHGGGNLTDGLRRFPQVFDELYLAMTHAGEASGALDLVLERLARFRERTERIQRRVKAAMIYPVIIMAVAGSILTGLMVFVVPKFQLIFNGVLKGQPLPPLTRVVIGAGGIMQHHYGMILGLGAMLVVGVRCLRRTRRGARSVDWLLINAPVVGSLQRKAAIARFTRTYGSLLASGVPMLDSLLITRAASGNVHLAEALTGIHDRVREGGTVARALEATAIFPGLVTSMIEVGEETGALPEMLGRVADTFDEEVDHAVSALTTIIEPIMIVLMALVVGVIVIALFLPIVGIVQHLQ